MDNQEQFKKLAKVFNIDKVVTTDDIQEVLSGVLNIMNSFKKQNETLNSETTKIVNNLLFKIKEENDKLNSDFSKQSNKVSNNINKKLEEANNFLQKIKEIKSTPGQDGKDAIVDEEKIVNDLMGKIKLPVYKETILDDRQKIVDKINTGKKDDLKIEVGQIGGLEKMHSDTLNRAVSILDQRTKYLINKTVKHDTSLSGSGTDADPLKVVAGTGGGHTIQDEGVSLTQRTKLNFKGAGVTVTEGGAGTDDTIVTIAGGRGSGDVTQDQSTPQTIGNTTNRLLKLWATDITATNPPLISTPGYIKGEKISRSFVITNPTASADLPLWRVPANFKVTAVHLLCKGNVTVGQLWQFDANGLNGATVDSSDITGVVDTNVNDDGTLSAPDITANNYLGWKTTSITGTPTYAIVSFEGYYS